MVPIDELYGLPLERFVPERTALARELRAGGRRDEATAVAGLRKPSVAAWAVNQLVRTQRRALDDLLAAGDALRETQAELLAGRGDGRALRDARESERDAVDVLTQAARGLLSSDGHGLSAATLDLVAGTLRAAALDDDARDQVRAGRLEHELTLVGFGDGLSGGVAAPAGRGGGRRSSAAAETKAKPRPKRDDKAQERAEAKRAEREHKAALKAARAAESEARRTAATADRALRAAEKRRDQAAAALEAADDELAQARAEAETAHEAHAQAQATLEEL